MKKFLLMNLMTALIATTSFASDSYDTSDDFLEYCIISINDVTQEMIEGGFFSANPHIIIEIPEGSQLPFGGVAIGGDFFSLEADKLSPQVINVVKTCYFRKTAETFLFSTDLENWGQFYEFFTGSVGFSTVFFNGVPSIQFNAQLNQRQ